MKLGVNLRAGELGYLLQQAIEAEGAGHCQVHQVHRLRRQPGVVVAAVERVRAELALFEVLRQRDALHARCSFSEDPLAVSGCRLVGGRRVAERVLRGVAWWWGG